MTTVYLATRNPEGFDPLDAALSISRHGWRYNDEYTPILYAASVQALAILEVVARPGWERVKEIAVFPIEVPDHSILTLTQLGIDLPTNWNNRPAASTARRIGAEFLKCAERERRRQGRPVTGALVPSVISTVDHTVLLDPGQNALYAVGRPARIPFDWLMATRT